MKNKKIAIIGAGPTGIFTALFLKNFDGEVHLFEKNSDIGEKLKLTGGGRMNITNKIFSADQFFSNTGERKKNHFFKNPNTRQENILKLFEELEIEYVWEKNRALLQSQDAKVEVKRLKEKILAQKNCTLHLNTEIVGITKNFELDRGNVPFQKFLLKMNTQEVFSFESDFLIITTGGMFQIKEQANKEKTYAFPELFGHTTTKISSSLSPFRIKYHFLLASSGIALPVKIFSGEYKKRQKSYEKEITDDLLITHFGISGPAVLDFSALWDEKEKFFLNFLPSFSREQFQKKISELRIGKNSIIKVLQGFFPHRLAENFCEILKFPYKYGEVKNIADLSKEEEKKLLDTLYSFDISKISLPEKFPYQGCWTTKGGIDLKDIEISTLESKLHQNLFFGGEILDIDGLCGGYHLSFSILCGKLISEKILK